MIANLRIQVVIRASPEHNEICSDGISGRD